MRPSRRGRHGSAWEREAERQGADGDSDEDTPGVDPLDVAQAGLVALWSVVPKLDGERAPEAYLLTRARYAILECLADERARLAQLARTPPDTDQDTADLFADPFANPPPTPPPTTSSKTPNAPGEPFGLGRGKTRGRYAAGARWLRRRLGELRDLG